MKIVVDGYNGDFSNDAYTLRVKVITPPQLPACPARTFAFPACERRDAADEHPRRRRRRCSSSTTARRRSTYGQTARTTLLDQAERFRHRPHPELKGAVLQVDGDAAVRTAKAAWDASPCSIGAANDVVRKINAVVARYRAPVRPNVQNIVIVGGDELDADGAHLRPDDRRERVERRRATCSSRPTGSPEANALFASEFLGNTLTDDAYTAGATIPWFGRELYLPQLAGGRLVETPDEIMSQLEQYIDANGMLDPRARRRHGLRLHDGRGDADQEPTSLAHTVGGNAPLPTSSNPLLTGGAPFIGPIARGARPTSSPTSTSSSLARGILSVNGHYNHWELAPAIDADHDIESTPSSRRAVASRPGRRLAAGRAPSSSRWAAMPA